MQQGSVGNRGWIRARAAAALVLLGAACADPGDQGRGGGAGTGSVLPPGTAGSGALAGSGGGAVLPTAGMGGSVPQVAAAPCDVSTVVADRCQTCHGATRIGGAPMSLLTYADLTRDYAVVTTSGLVGRTMKMSDLIRIRINREMGTTPMPQGAPLATAELATLNDWIAAGAPVASAGNGCSGQGMAGTGGGGAGMGSGGSGGTGGSGTGGNVRTSTWSDEHWQAPQPGETCYELLTHGDQTPDDASPYMVRIDEHYEQFYYAVPWTTPVNGTRFGARYDNLGVLHHWLLFSSAKPIEFSGTHETVIGTQIGDDSALIAGWAVGGEHTIPPDNVEIKLPPPNTLLNVQWHYYNNTGVPQPDSSAILICTVPPDTREHVGSITWLGTEDFNGFIGMEPGFKGEFSGTCPNDSAGPITIFFFWPHMHEIGRNLRSVVNRVGGGQEEVFNMPFDFNHQVHYPANVVLQPGDSITSYCRFDNTTDANVAFGPSTLQEMCYQFAFSYPAGALDNGVFSLIGATNTCW